jgi:hypothetical protein
MSTEIPLYTDPSQTSDQQTVKYNNLNKFVQKFSVTYNKEMNTTGDTTSIDDYNTDLTDLKKSVETFVSENRTLSDKLFADKQIQLRMKKRGTTIGPLEYSKLKTTLDAYKTTSNEDNKGTPEYILKLLENDIFYILDGTIKKSTTNNLKYDITINTMSEPYNICPAIQDNTIFNEKFDKPYIDLSNNLNILRDKLQPLENYSGKKFKLCIKISNSETDIKQSTLVNMTIFN